MQTPLLTLSLQLVCKPEGNSLCIYVKQNIKTFEKVVEAQYIHPYNVKRSMKTSWPATLQFI